MLQAGDKAPDFTLLDQDGEGILRTTFIVDADSRIARVFPKVQPKKHDALVLKALGALSGGAST
jgi:peroxiredoxin